MTHKLSEKDNAPNIISPFPTQRHWGETSKARKLPDKATPKYCLMRTLAPSIFNKTKKIIAKAKGIKNQINFSSISIFTLATNGSISFTQLHQAARLFCHDRQLEQIL